MMHGTINIKCMESKSSHNHSITHLLRHTHTHTLAHARARAH